MCINMPEFSQREKPAESSSKEGPIGSGLDRFFNSHTILLDQSFSRAKQWNAEMSVPSSSPISIVRLVHDFGKIRMNAGRQAMLQTRMPANEHIQAKLAVSQPEDKYEQEADRIADQVIASPPHSAIIGAPQRLQRLSEHSNGQMDAAPDSVEHALASPGRPLDTTLRQDMEQRFGHDFSRVRVHSGGAAEQSARDVNANAYTIGHNIVFGAGRFASGTHEGRRLIAHELTHVVQQDGQDSLGKIWRSSADFCTAYATAAEATATEARLRSYFLPLMGAKFGAEVRGLWESYLSRAPGASLSPRVFATPGNPIEESFATSRATDNDQDDVLDLVIDRVNLFPGGRLPPHTYTVSSLTNYLSASEMNNRPIDYSNPFSKAGNIAGGIGTSDAGPDYRKIISANVGMEKVPIIGDSGYINFRLIPHYEVFDAVDFCDGQSGSPLEEILTIPLSRLEASGEAYDVPYIVRFRPQPRTKREFYSSFPI
jgi:hypothetical protein